MTDLKLCYYGALDGKLNNRTRCSVQASTEITGCEFFITSSCMCCSLLLLAEQRQQFFALLSLVIAIGAKPDTHVLIIMPFNLMILLQTAFHKL